MTTVYTPVNAIATKQSVLAKYSPLIMDIYIWKNIRRRLWIYICIYWVLLGVFDAINPSNQRTICSCTIFQPSCIILYFIFSINSVVFYEIFYNDITTLLWRHSFLTDSNEYCTAYYVKLNSKIFLLVDFFLGIFIEKITIYYENHVSPIPFEPPIRVGSVRDTSFTYLRILFQKNKNDSFYQKWWKPGLIPITKPPLWPPTWEGGILVGTRSPLIFWDTFPPYLRMLFQQKTIFAIFDLNLGW